jgi:regulatory protein
VTEPIITKVEPLRPRGLKVRLHLDPGDPVEVMLEALERSRLGVGDPFPAERRAHLLDMDADVRVRDAALSLVSYRARTRRELERRLRQKGFASDRIAACLDRLEERGFVDDAAVAAAFVRDRLRHRPRGRSRLSSELRAKGVDREVAENVIGRVFGEEETSDVRLGREVAANWVARQSASLLTALASRERSPDHVRAHRRLIGYLTRRGFRGEAVQEAVRRAVELAGGPS